MGKLCPFCKKKIKDEDICPHCHRIIREKVKNTPYQPNFTFWEEKQHKNTSQWFSKPFKLTKGWVIGGLTLLALVYFIPRLNDTPTTSLTPTPTPTPTLTLTLTKCTRTTPYSMPPEFERALSLIKQRTSQYYSNVQAAEYRNCLNIQYSDLKRYGDNVEGVFVLDKSASNLNNLVIYVDNSYQKNDDLLTAILLVHEITHARQYYDYLVNGKNLKSCMEQEIEAFQTQFEFLKALTDEERNSIFYRIGTIIDTGRSVVSNPRELTNPALVNLNKMITIFLNAAKYRCRMDPTCTINLTAQGIRDMVENSPAYKKQCNIN